MKNLAKGVVFLSVTIMAVVFINAATTSSPSETIHKQLNFKHDLMMSKAVEVIDQIESSPTKSEFDSVYYHHPASVWSITALEGEEATMVNITIDDANLNYKLHLSATKKKGQPAEYTQYSIYEQPTN